MRLLLAAAAARLALLAWGAWQDAHLAVRYTDVDYDVFTDAAAAMARGGSPYARATYRYTPLLAAALLPNVWLHPAWGKVLFAAADLGAAALLRALLVARGASRRAAAAAAAVWLFSPFTATISTRGNGEALVACMLLGALLLLGRRRCYSAGLLYGLATHWRIYPAIFALPLARHLALAAQAARRRAKRPPPRRALARAWASLFSWDGLRFGGAAAAAFFGLGAGCYRAYGRAFLHEAFLYHAGRVDPRHNFSPFFYPAYLIHGGNIAGASGIMNIGSSSFFGASGRGGALLAAVGDSGWAFAAAQAAAQATLGWRLAADPAAALLAQTVAFVALNRVATAQYFVWWLAFLPLLLPELAARLDVRRARALGGAAAAWAAAVGHWLAWAYALEFRGAPVHAGVWAAALLLLGASAALLRALLAALGAGGAAKAKATRR